MGSVRLSEKGNSPQKPHAFIYNDWGWCNYTRKWTRLRYRCKASGVVCASSLNFDLLCSRPINSADPRSQTVHNRIARSHYTITEQIRFRSKSSAYCRHFVCRRGTHHTNHWIGVGHLCTFFQPLSACVQFILCVMYFIYWRKCWVSGESLQKHCLFKSYESFVE